MERVIRLDPAQPAADETQPPWRVLIIDDHPMMREVVTLACSSNPRLEVVGGAGDGRRALQMVDELAPHVVVLDMDIPGLNGIEVARALRESKNPARILVLTGSADPHIAFECLRLDVEGYTDKLTPFEELPNIIEDVAGGKRSISVGAEREASKEFGHFLRSQREKSRTKAALTPRELEVLEMIGRARTNMQMARRLGLSERTIESHVAKLYRKLGVKTRTAAALKGASLGLIPEIGEPANA